MTWSLNLPPSWQTGDWLELNTIAEGQLANGRTALLISGILADGTNIMAVLWDGGQRILRMGVATGWAVQEHYTGQPAASSAIERMWSVAVNAIIAAKAETIAEIGPLP